MTVSDAFAAAVDVGEIAGSSSGRGRARARARGYRPLSVAGKAPADVPAEPKPWAVPTAPNVLDRLRGVVSAALATVRADAAGSWPLRNHPPSFADLWADRAPAVEAYPGESEALRAVDVGWRHLALVPYGLVFGYLWLLHRAVTGVPTVLITLALAGMWIN
jgi:hypothetical protein